MSVIAFTSGFLLRMLVVLVPLNLAMITCGYFIGWRRLAVENGVIENTQLVVLAISLAVGAFAAFKSSHLLRLAMAAWCALMLLLLQREFDFTLLGEDSWLFALRSSHVRLIYWIPILAILAIWASRHFREILRAIASLRWRHLWPTILIVVLGVASQLMENAQQAYRRYFKLFYVGEELMELNVYCIMAMVVIAIAARILRPGSPEIADGRNRLLASA